MGNRATPSLTTTCRLCGGGDLVHKLSCRGFDLFSCRDCSYVQVDPVPSIEVINSIYGEEYFHKSKYRDDVANRHEQARRVQLLKRAGVPRKGKVLDIGCASGEFISAANERFEAWGIDISQHAVARAKAHNTDAADRIFYANPYRFELPDEKFDAVVLWDVLEHLIDPERSIEQAVAQLKPDGVLICSTPNISTTTAKIMGKRWAFMTPPEHLGFFNPASLSLLLSKEGLTPRFWMSRGKWANIGFLAYKLRRVLPELMPATLVNLVHRSFVGSYSVYVPTGDVLYMIGSKG